jgi:CBS domain-containing protein
MKKKEPVSAIMTKNIHAVQIKDKLNDALEIVRKYGVRHVPVLKGKQLVGIISKTDLNRLSFSGMFEGEEDADEAVFDMLTIAQVMSNKPRVVKQSDTIYNVAEILSKEEFHALPVVEDDDDTKLVGIVTTTDVIRYMLEQGYS